MKKLIRCGFTALYSKEIHVQIFHKMFFYISHKILQRQGRNEPGGLFLLYTCSVVIADHEMQEK